MISYFDLNKGKDQFVVFEWDGEGWARCPTKLLETGLGAGHQPYDLDRRLKTPLTYCTILRDSLVRHISHYRYALNGRHGEVARASVSQTEALVRRALSLDEWVSESLGGSNVFVQMRSGHSTPDKLSLEIAKANSRASLQHGRHLRKHERVYTLGLCKDVCSSRTAKRKRLRTRTADSSTRCATALSPAGW